LAGKVDLDPRETEELRRRTDELHTEVLSRHPAGQIVLDLKKKRDEILDRVWLARNLGYLQHVWNTCLRILGDHDESMARTPNAGVTAVAPALDSYPGEIA
jgi:hypothetical protein